LQKAKLTWVVLFSSHWQSPIEKPGAGDEGVVQSLSNEVRVVKTGIVYNMIIV